MCVKRWCLVSALLPWVSDTHLSSVGIVAVDITQCRKCWHVKLTNHFNFQQQHVCTPFTWSTLCSCDACAAFAASTKLHHLSHCSYNPSAGALVNFLTFSMSSVHLVSAIMLSLLYKNLFFFLECVDALTIIVFNLFYYFIKNGLICFLKKCDHFIKLIQSIISFNDIVYIQL